MLYCSKRSNDKIQPKVTQILFSYQNNQGVLYYNNQGYYLMRQDLIQSLDLRNNANNISLLSLMIPNINNQEYVKRH